MTSDNGDASSPAKTRFSVLLTETKCVLQTVWLLLRNEVAMPHGNVGRSISFADGSRSVVYRETAMRDRRHDGLVLIVVRFQLRFIGRNRLAHWLFRFESLLNTLLFAAHPGFQTKLWLTDHDSGYYRGIYEWRGRRAAVEYAENLRVVLRPWVRADSFAYHVIDGPTRTQYLEGAVGDELSASGDAWWQVAPHSPLVARADELR